MQSFLIAQALFSLLPVLLFASFVLGTVSLAVISALLFSLFWTGIAALVLGSTLFLTSGLALLAWAWFVGAYLAVTFVYGLVFAAGGVTEESRVVLEEFKNLVDKKEPDVAGLDAAEGRGDGEEKRGGVGELNGEGGL